MKRFFRILATPVTAPVKAVRRTARLLRLRARGETALAVADEAAAAPTLYRDQTWQRRMVGAILRLIAALPLPQEVRDMSFLNTMLANRKTTLVGLSMIIGALAALANGVPFSDEKVIGGILGGLGFLFAKDGNVTGVGADARRG